MQGSRTQLHTTLRSAATHPRCSGGQPVCSKPAPAYWFTKIEPACALSRPRLRPVHLTSAPNYHPPHCTLHCTRLSIKWQVTGSCRPAVTECLAAPFARLRGSHAAQCVQHCVSGRGVAAGGGRWRSYLHSRRSLGAGAEKLRAFCISVLPALQREQLVACKVDQQDYMRPTCGSAPAWYTFQSDRETHQFHRKARERSQTARGSSGGS